MTNDDLKKVLSVYYDFLNRNNLSWWDYDFYEFLDGIAELNAQNIADYVKKTEVKK